MLAVPLLLVLLSAAPESVAGTRERCIMDCRSSDDRSVGPTRPWDAGDLLGNALSLTRPHPYSVAGDEVAVLRFEVTLRVVRGRPSSFSSDATANSAAGGRYLLEGLKESMLKKLNSLEFRIVEERSVASPLRDGTGDDGPLTMDFVVSIGSIADHNGYNLGTADDFFREVLLPAIRSVIESGALAEAVGGRLARAEGREEEEEEDDDDDDDDDGPTKRLTVEFPPFPYDVTAAPYRANLALHGGRPNPYAKFCEVGCVEFFSSSDPVTLDECTGKCDGRYEYNVTVGYSDVAEVARLECRDGCQMALIRCQPGYYCSQVVPSRVGDDSEKGGGGGPLYAGGIMTQCPAGTYRDVSYGAVEECLPCPPGRYREDIKGRDLESCAKCRVGTYAAHPGGTSVRDCLRCPAGRFNSEEGGARWKCIRPMACEGDGPASPADSEKRDTVPFIGRW